MSRFGLIIIMVTGLFWASLVSSAFAAGKGAGSGSMTGVQGGSRMETEQRSQKEMGSGGMEHGDKDQMRTRTYNEDRVRLETHYQDRIKKMDDGYKKEQEQLRQRYEKQKMELEQKQHKEMQQLEEQYRKKS